MGLSPKRRKKYTGEGDVKEVRRKPTAGVVGFDEEGYRLQKVTYDDV